MALRVAAGLLDTLVRTAAGMPDREICGLLFGADDRIEYAQPAENIADHPQDTFEIDPRALFAALRAERAGGPRLIGHYHSHPNGRAEPSPRDLAAAEPGKYWLIIGGSTARLWLAGPSGFTEVQLIVNHDRASGG
jgi:proteasome lid subunit RPN8/RPN11